MPSSSSCNTEMRWAAARWIFAWVTGSTIRDGRGWMDIGFRLYGVFLPGERKGWKALGLGSSRIATSLDDPGVFVEGRRRDEPFGPVGRDIEVVAATTQLVEYLGAEARLDPHAV